MGSLLNQFHVVNQNQPHTPLFSLPSRVVFDHDIPKYDDRCGNRGPGYFFYFNGAGEYV